MKAQAKTILFESVTSYPWNWSAWLDLASLIDNIEDVKRFKLKEHWMKDFFIAHIFLELQRNNESLSIYENLATVFPHSSYVLAQTAMANYNLREYDTAEAIFEKLEKKEPYRLDNMDTYSNILYVKEDRAKLSYLAHNANTTDKYRPETCCIIGNYYSLKSEHEKAVMYFKRALKLNANYLSAWTLMGHEYVEMKNTAAAIEAYRRAVDINPCDYRAWYGLGQTYEIVTMPYYSLYYYRKAAFLRPYDARMWCAMAGSYESLNRIEEAIKCYERAECNNDREGIALSKLASLYKTIGQIGKAALYYEKNLNRRDQEEVEGQETVDALLFLANYYKASNINATEAYCLRLLEYAGPEKEEAKAILREIRSSKLNSDVIVEHDTSIDLEDINQEDDNE